MHKVTVMATGSVIKERVRQLKEEWQTVRLTDENGEEINVNSLGGDSSRYVVDEYTLSANDGVG